MTPYVFISYAHADSKTVLPIVEAMKEAGICIWYDGGIEAGSEWPEYIAEKVANCSKFVLFISKAYLNSQNCKRELNFAISRKKELLSIYVEEVELSLGVEMQLGTYQALFKNRFSSEEQFLSRICGEHFFDPCRVKTDPPTAPIPSEPTGERPAPAAPIEEIPAYVPPSEVQPAPVNPSQKKPVSAPIPQKKSVSGKKKGKMIPLLAGVSAAAVICLAILLSLLGRVTISGERIKRNTTRVSLYYETVTQEDMKTVASLKKLEELNFTGCTLEAGAVKQLQNIRGPLRELSLETCEGIDDYSGIAAAEQLESLRIVGCGLTNDQLKSMELGNKTLLETLELSQNPQLSEIPSLTALTELAVLNVDLTAVREFSMLKGCDALSELSAQGCGVEDLSTLSNKGITELVLNYNAITELAPLASFEALERLELQGNKITSLSALEGKTALNTLYLSENRINDLSPLSSLISLKWLQLSDNKIGSLKPLSSLTALLQLHVNRNQLTALAGLENALELRELQASENRIKEINGLTNCTVLEEVNLNSNGISDLSLLGKSAAALKRVYFSENKVADLSFLQNATQLTHLTFDHNKVSSLKPLENAVALRALSGEYNEITSLAGLDKAAALKDLYLAHNKITDMEAFLALSAASAADFNVVDLSSNNISKLLLQENKKYAFLAVYNNPIESFDQVKRLSGTRFLFTYVDGMALDGFNDAFYSYTVVDCPKDRQLSVEEAIHGYARDGTFRTVEEADQLTLETKTKQITGSTQADVAEDA